jgi:excisionase family DNA binding protein
MKDGSTFGVGLAGRALVSKKEVAHTLGCSVRTVERLVAVGALEKVMVLGAVRFRLSDIERIVMKGAA